MVIECWNTRTDELIRGAEYVVINSFHEEVDDKNWNVFNNRYL